MAREGSALWETATLFSPALCPVPTRTHPRASQHRFSGLMSVSTEGLKLRTRGRPAQPARGPRPGRETVAGIVATPGPLAPPERATPSQTPMVLDVMPVAAGLARRLFRGRPFKHPTEEMSQQISRL